MIIKNFDQLAITPQRKQLLQIIESGLLAIQPEVVLQKNFSLENNVLTILDQTYNLGDFENIFLIGFGKGSAKNSKLIENILGNKLKEGYVIDTQGQDFKTIHFSPGTHPVVSQQNVEFTEKVMTRFSNCNERDLILVVVCGGGSAMFEHPHSVSLDQKIAIEKALLKSGANIIEMNKIRQHLSDVKGGGLAQILYPATVATLIFSDVPGNDISYIASGPTVKDSTTINDALKLIQKFNLPDVQREAFIDNPKDDRYFQNVSNHIILSNLTALNAMKKRAEQMGIKTEILTDKLQGEARKVAINLLTQTPNNSLLLAGGETTVTAKGDGKGGRNQEATLSALLNLTNNSIFCSIDSDGWDNSEAAGALCDQETLSKTENQDLKPKKFLEDNDSYTFFEKVGNGIITGRLPSNVADLLLVFKYDRFN